MDGRGGDVNRASASEPDSATEDTAGEADRTDRERPAASAADAIATARDASGIPIHRGWAPLGGHHRWMEPFVMVLLASGAVHGYAIVGELAGLGITDGPIDVGAVYRTLRDLEQAGHVRSAWATGSGPARREYELTAAGEAALDEWAAVMKERARLVGEFDARYFETVALRRR